MKKSKINIYCPGWRVGDNSFGVTTTYLEFMAKYGNPNILMPHDEYPPDNCDLLLLPGGADIMASSVGQLPGFMNSNPDTFKQTFYNNYLKNYIEAKIPILGICWGHQALLNFFGGFEYKQNAQWHPSSEDRYQEGHLVYFNTEKFYKGKPDIKSKLLQLSVNSHHHQLVLVPREMMKNDYNGDWSVGDIVIESIYPDSFEPTIESFYHKYLPIVGIQHHGEEAISKQHELYMRNIMNYLLSFKKVGASAEVVT